MALKTAWKKMMRCPPPYPQPNPAETMASQVVHEEVNKALLTIRYHLDVLSNKLGEEVQLLSCGGEKGRSYLSPHGGSAPP